MVARTPPKHKKMVAPLNPVLLRETVKKVDRCMARLQELQYTVAGGTKVVSGVSLSPRSTRGEWRRMSLPAMLVGETVGEILQASQFAREIVSVVSNKTKKTSSDDPKTPVTEQRKQRPYAEDTELKAKRRKEKQNKLQSIRSESVSPTLQRARSRINFKISPPNKRELEKENSRYVANRVSPKHRPWAKKTVLFPNPLFLSTPSAQQQKFCKTRSPVIARYKQPPQTPHKFLIKSPTSASKFQVKIKSPPLVSRSPPTRATSLSLSKKSSPTRIKVKSPSLVSRSPPTRATSLTLSKKSSPTRIKIKSPPLVSRSPPKRATGLGKKSPKMSTASKLRRSFSPSRLATRLVSPLKSRKSVQKSESLVSGLKQRPTSSIPMGLSARRI
ncbi:hypothetical protein FEM48_Zijuj02G0144700 [Ziziphus jujuba var. spinosa]|uniref:Microtubule-binding protein TANGLED n=1 Tax=Ziziphus jujuba var. spinosa TaxID=714518 RepID=A0A978VW79_ZIZJJ|nr:hypothetical protein FEM48_Zijuj02G0144700 [Ziziphus jujuba var. spinosa]